MTKSNLHISPIAVSQQPYVSVTYINFTAVTEVVVDVVDETVNDLNLKIHNLDAYKLDYKKNQPHYNG